MGEILEDGRAIAQDVRLRNQTDSGNIATPSVSLGESVLVSVGGGQGFNALSGHVRAGGGGEADANNSTTSTLGASGVFTGTTPNTGNPWNSIAITALSDQASSDGGLQIQFSNDGTNYDKILAYTVAASTPFSVVVPRLALQYRIVYTNGSVAQSTFRLAAHLFANQPVAVPSRARNADSEQSGVALVKAFPHRRCVGRATVTKSTTGNSIVVAAPGTGKSLAIRKIHVRGATSQVSAVDIAFRFTTTGTQHYGGGIAANDGFDIDFAADSLWQGGVNEALYVNVPSGSPVVAITVDYDVLPCTEVSS